MKKLLALWSIVLIAGLVTAACAKSSQTTTTEGTPATAETSMAQATTAAAALPIPLAKLPSAKVTAGNVAAGATVFAANCESCHGAKGIGGGVGPKLAGAGLKPGQVAFMIRQPQAVDKTSSMPKLTLSDKQIADVSAYVASLK